MHYTHNAMPTEIPANISVCVPEVWTAANSDPVKSGAKMYLLLLAVLLIFSLQCRPGSPIKDPGKETMIDILAYLEKQKVSELHPASVRIFNNSTVSQNFILYTYPTTYFTPACPFLDPDTGDPYPSYDFGVIAAGGQSAYQELRFSFAYYVYMANSTCITNLNPALSMFYGEGYTVYNYECFIPNDDGSGLFCKQLVTSLK